jgi:hypothetical protein
VRLDPATWEVLEASVPGGSADGDLSLQACAAAYALLVSLGTAARFLPSASAGAVGASVGHPGYEE